MNLTSALDAVVHVRDAALAFEDPRALELDLLGGEAIEQTAALAKEHGDHVELKLIEYAGGKCKLRGSGAVDEHVLVTRGLFGPSHCSRDVSHVGNQGHLRELGGRLVSAKDVDRHAVVMVTAPAPGRLEGSPPGDG